MFHEDRDIVTKLKVESKHFSRLFDKHNALNDKIDLEGEHIDSHELEQLKKEKLKLKDELYAMIVEHKKAN
jgi:uncharacterized protein YdcH (DUF465 family)